MLSTTHKFISTKEDRLASPVELTGPKKALQWPSPPQGPDAPIPRGLAATGLWEGWRCCCLPTPPTVPILPQGSSKYAAKFRGFSGDPMVKTTLPVQGAWV